MAVNIINPSNSRTSQLADLEANAVLLVNEGAYIYSNLNGNPAYFANGGGANLTIRGTIGGNTGFSAIYLGQNDSFTAGGGNRVAISQSGVIQGYGGVTLHGGGNWITNQGLIQATGASDPNTLSTNEPAAVFALGAGNRIENSGAMSGFYGIYVQGSETVVVNSGTITGTGNNALRLIGTSDIKNTGTIIGDVSTFNAPSDLYNSGLIEGFVFLSGGSSVTNYGTITEGCTTNTGDDFVSNFGTIRYVSTIDGEDFVFNRSGGIIGSVSFGLFGSDAAADTFTNEGEVGSVSFDIASDRFTNSGIVTSSVSMSGGNNSFDNTGRVDGSAGFGDGIDTIFNQGFVGSIFAGGGTDRIFNGSEGVVSTGIFLDGGDTAIDVLVNHGVIGVDLSGFGQPAIVFGDGADTFTNTGTVYGSVDMGIGIDTDILTNSGLIAGPLSFGAGDDSVDTSAGVIGGRVDLGAGVDVYLGGAGVDKVIGGGDADSIDLAGGDDVYRAVNGDDNDEIDGGSGIDTYNASAATLSVVIDLNAEVTAGTIGTDTLTGFENIVGGQRNDTLTGSAGVNRIDGDLGNDVIDGGGGDDRLIGGIGTDTIIGAAGRDVMTGGSDGDTFRFAAGDSGTTAGTRDVISDFRDHGSAAAPFARGADVIDLSLIDAVTTAGGNQAFTFDAIDGAAFSGSAGSLIWAQRDGYALVSGDVNGDSRADFTLQLNGTHILFASDFVL